MIAIHAGFVKTATSTLQRGVFSQHEGINYLGLPAPDDRLAAAIHAVAKTDSVCFGASQIRAIFHDYLDGASGRMINLISYENFTLYESPDKGMMDLCGSCILRSNHSANSMKLFPEMYLAIFCRRPGFRYDDQIL